jgi:hypothetical protein
LTHDTADHPIWINGRGWTNAIDVHPGDTASGAHGTAVPLPLVRDEGLQPRQLVYNLTIANRHTFSVSIDAAMLVTHNCSADLTSRHGSSRAAFRAAKRHWGVESRATPIERFKTSQGRGYVYTNNRGSKVVIVHHRDIQHGRHWEGGLYKGRSRQGIPTYRAGRGTGLTKTRHGYAAF